MKPSQLFTFLCKAVPAGLNVLVTGQPGVGKTDTMGQVVATLGMDLVVNHPAVEDPTVPAGLPWANKGDKEATFLPFGNTAKVLKATRPTLWALEDFGQSTPATQAGYMQYLLARECNGHKLPDCVTMIALTNRRTDRSGVSGILEAVKSRFCSIVNLDADLNDWCNWAFDHNIPDTLIAFIRYRPELLSAFAPTADLTNSPIPRTWAHLGKLETLNLPAEIEAIAFAGAVGEGAATEYLVFRQMYKSLVNIDSILIDPAHAAIPTRPDQLYATSMGLAGRATPQNFDRIATYVTRLATEGTPTRGEFAVLTVRDALRRDAKVAYTNAYVKLQSGPLGQLFSGQA